jgi:hypothetical protein
LPCVCPSGARRHIREDEPCRECCESAIDERPARNAGSSKSGRRYLTFKVDGADFELAFGRVLLEVGMITPNSGALTAPTGERALALDDETKGLPSGLHFRCLAH